MKSLGKSGRLGKILSVCAAGLFLALGTAPSVFAAPSAAPKPPEVRITTRWIQDVFVASDGSKDLLVWARVYAEPSSGDRLFWVRKVNGKDKMTEIALPPNALRDLGPQLGFPFEKGTKIDLETNFYSQRGELQYRVVLDGNGHKRAELQFVKIHEKLVQDIDGDKATERVEIVREQPFAKFERPPAPWKDYRERFEELRTFEPATFYDSRGELSRLARLRIEVLNAIWNAPPIGEKVFLAIKIPELEPLGAANMILFIPKADMAIGGSAMFENLKLAIVGENQVEILEKTQNGWPAVIAAPIEFALGADQTSKPALVRFSDRMLEEFFELDPSFKGDQFFERLGNHWMINWTYHPPWARFVPAGGNRSKDAEVKARLIVPDAFKDVLPRAEPDAGSEEVHPFLQRANLSPVACAGAFAGKP